MQRFLPELKKILRALQQVQFIATGIIVVGLFTYAAGIVRSELNTERNQSTYNEALSDVEKVIFDRDAVETIVKLRDLDIDVSTVFDQSRVNPFED